MGKNKKRHQMQKVNDEHLMRFLLDQSAALGLFERVGYDEHGEPQYMMSPKAEARAEVLRKIINSQQPSDE